MAGDVPIQEGLLIADPHTPAIDGEIAEGENGTHVLHRYGDRIAIVETPEESDEAAETVRARGAAADTVSEQLLGELSEVEALGVAALQLRRSDEYRSVKQNRPNQGEPWNVEGGCTAVAEAPMPRGAEAQAGAPTSAFLEGSVAVGIIIVEGPTADLQFSEAERTKVVAEVQNGLSWLASVNPWAGVTFTYDIRTVRISTAPNPSAADLEGLWRNPAMQALGYEASWNGVVAYVEAIRNQFRTRWTYCGYFTKYPVGHFAYASIGGPRIVMHYNNDGWGPDNIDRVFAHETGHIFGCPDEYAASGCDCAGNWGRFGRPNRNCANCAPGGGVACIMKGNDWAMCAHTPAHFGWDANPMFVKHSRKAADIAAASTANGAGLQQWGWWGGGNQKFRFVLAEPGYYRILVDNSEKSLDVAGISTADGARITQWDYWGGDNQKFRLEAVGDGLYRIVAKHSNKCFDVTAVSTADGAAIQQWPWNGGDNQRFAIAIPPRAFFAKHSNKAIDIAGIAHQNGAQAHQWVYWGGPNQRFRIEPVEPGWYRLVAEHSGKCLDVQGGSAANGARIIQWDWWGGNNQKFRFDPLGDGHYRIVAKHSNKCFDVHGISTANGAALQQWDWWGGDNQRFRF